MKKPKDTFCTKLPPDIYIQMVDYGPAVEHNLICWWCRENHAVYSITPEWVFKPCWECQAKLGMTGIKLKPKKWYQFWK